MREVDQDGVDCVPPHEDISHVEIAMNETESMLLFGHLPKQLPKLIRAGNGGVCCRGMFKGHAQPISRWKERVFLLSGLFRISLFFDVLDTQRHLFTRGFSAPRSERP